MIRFKTRILVPVRIHSVAQDTSRSRSNSFHLCIGENRCCVEVLLNLDDSMRLLSATEGARVCACERVIC